ncbi:S1C family serine protease [Kangiella aquimarina]|uniref:Trypsin-like peptidase domain-containing protein n=1 Tax=Kangiella aquimarina TaxID=261965 RepID=A0ABZ0X380_9GAMM|nr:trypsin-like peptidase domain-containing protein [Kangiella aquimarina]WQG85055.1 trypsin-like peptidase domain-containing protein [Kangiella aquimarina]
MQFLTYIGYIIKYLLVGLGIAALFIVFMPGRFSINSPSEQTTDSTVQVPQQVVPFSGYADMLDKARPAVVSIQARSKLYPLNDPECQNSLRAIPSGTNACAFLNNGSGVFIDEQGHIVTNAHVLDKAESIIVELLNGQKLAATVIGLDKDSDLALLKVDYQPQHILSLGQEDKSRVGDIVFAIGTPYMAFEQTVTQGIISAKFFSRVSHYIQTDAALRSGNSGGALVNSQGELVGITALSSRDESGEKTYQNFAIAAADVQHVVNELLENGVVQRGWLGLNGDMTINFRSIVQEMNLPLPQQQLLASQIEQLPFGQGIVITAVNGNGPADKAGLQALDIITEVNGKPINSTADLMAAIWNVAPETEIQLEYYRDGQKNQAEVILGYRD